MLSFIKNLKAGQPVLLPTNQISKRVIRTPRLLPTKPDPPDNITVMRKNLLLLLVIFPLANLIAEETRTEPTKEEIEAAAKAWAAAMEDRMQNFDEAKEPWEKCEIKYPRKEKKVVFYRQTAHPFLAEYNRRVGFGDQKKDQIRYFPMNTGGRTNIEVFYLEVDGSPYLRMKDRQTECLISIKEEKVFSYVRAKDRIFIGEVDFDYSGQGYSHSEKSGFRAHVGDNEAVDITGTPLANDGEYIGRLDARRSELKFVTEKEEHNQSSEDNSE